MAKRESSPVQVRVTRPGKNHPVKETADAVKRAERSVSAAVYKFDKKSMLRAVRKALGAGAEVRLLVDRIHATKTHKSLVRDAVRAGAEVRYWPSGKLHAKFTIVEEKWVLTGSYNWTKSVKKNNAELSLVFEDKETAKTFHRLFEEMWGEGIPAEAASTHAGGVVFRRGKDGPRVLIVRARKDPAQWVFPKGHIEGEETSAEAALREVREEAGVTAKAVDFLGTRDLDGTRVDYYLMERLEVEEQAEPEDARQPEWLTLEAAGSKLSFPEARQLLRAAERMIAG